MRADFWDVVRVRPDAEDVGLRGRVGHVLGIGGEIDEPDRSIFVWFYDTDTGECVDERDLILLGHKDMIAAAARERALQEGPRLRVVVDDSGVGRIDDDD